MKLEPTTKASPFIKWPGGKTSELDLIFQHAPNHFERFFDPFLGGGSVLLAVSADIERYGNDLCFELIELFRIISSSSQHEVNPLLELLKEWEELSLSTQQMNEIILGFVDGKIIKQNVKLISNSKYPEVNTILRKTSLLFSSELEKKLLRTQKIQVSKGVRLSSSDLEKTVHGVLKGCFYYAIRDEYNLKRVNRVKDIWRVYFFYVLRELAYAAMFRFNSKDEFNVPYGGISYNEKNLISKITQQLTPEANFNLSRIHFFNEDYRQFLDRFLLTERDFVFVDPPYDTEFSSYDNKSFARSEQIELSKYLSSLSAKVMIVIGKSTLIDRLYTGTNWNIIESDKSYLWNIKSRNDGRTKHLLIRNYL